MCSVFIKTTGSEDVEATLTHHGPTVRHENYGN